MQWMVEESDALAKKNLDKHGSTYIRMARNVAEIIQNYARSAKRFDQLVGEKKALDTMQRFLGTHQSVGESFLARLVEKTCGREERDQFLKAVGGAGFDFVEGFQVEIRTSAGSAEPKIVLHYKKTDKDGKLLYLINQTIEQELLKEMIDEGSKFDDEMK